MKQDFLLTPALLLVACGGTDITPRANTAPTVELTATVLRGPAPFTTTFTASAADTDSDPLTYAWSIDGEATSPTLAHTFEQPGLTEVSVTVTDGQAEATATAKVEVLSVGPIPGAEPLELPGRVLDWQTGQTAVLEARHELGNLLGTGTVAADGSFDVTIAPPTTFRRYADVYFSCKNSIVNTIELSNPDARLVRLLTLLPLTEALSIGLRDDADTLTRFAIISYVDTPLTISGVIRCGDIPGYVWNGIYEDTRFNAGWNVVVQTPTFAPDGLLLDVRYEAFPVDQMPDGIGWYIGGYDYANRPGSSGLVDRSR